MKTLLAGVLLAVASIAGAGPKLNLTTVDGSIYDLAAHRGKYVIVNFWATWCGPCIKEMPELSELDQARDDIDVIGLAFEEIELADMQSFLKKRPVAYPIAIVDVYDPPADFPAPKGLPMTFLIGPDGEVLQKFLGPVTRKELEQVVDKAAGKDA